MRIQHKRWSLALLPLVLSGGLMMASSFTLQAKTERLVIENGDNSLSREEARENKEQWNETHSLRKKIHTRSEKEFDKADQAFDKRDACNASSNVNVYWEPNTLRCLDRQTGRPVLAP